MKKIIALVGVAFLNSISFSQAPIPNYWDCSDATNPPIGYTVSGASNYTALGINNGPSLRFNSQGNSLKIFLAAEAGVFSYYIKGTNPPNTGLPFDGEFNVQISDNGTTWTTKRSFVDGALDVTNLTMYSDTVLPTTRYIRFHFTRKESGFNVSLDEINVGAPLPKPEAEINVVMDGSTVFSGGNYYTGSNVSITKQIKLAVQNLGLDSTLKITGVTSSNATEFAVTSFPSTVASNGVDTIKINFTPSAAGTRTSTISISNNDLTENPYLINLIGYGNGLATEPAVPTATSANVKSYKYTVNIVPNTPLNDEGYLVLFNKSGVPNTAPMDGVTYSPGDMIGNSKVAFVGKTLTYTSKETRANQTDNLKVYAYSGSGQYTNYTATGFDLTVSSSPSMQSPAYYSTISTSSNSFVTDLHNLVNPHTLKFYSDFDDTYIKEFASRDTSNGQKVVTCRYTGDEYIYTEPFGFNYISREHSFPQSWMPTYGNETLPEFNDYHNLFPVNQDNANGVRSNNPLGVVVSVTSSFKEGKYGVDANGNNVYEPRDDHKGDAARAIFYMSIAYTGVSNNLWALPNPIDPIFVNYGQDQDLLKQWHWQDPVSNEEIARNDYIASLQGNRNPFVDSMQYACFIDFTSMTKVNTAAPCTSTPTSLEEISAIKNLNFYPNPTTDWLTIHYTLNSTLSSKIEILNAVGEVIQAKQIALSSTVNENISLKDLAKGIYYIRVSGENINALNKFVKL